MRSSYSERCCHQKGILYPETLKNYKCKKDEIGPALRVEPKINFASKDLKMAVSNSRETDPSRNGLHMTLERFLLIVFSGE